MSNNKPAVRVRRGPGGPGGHGGMRGSGENAKDFKKTW